MLRKSNLPISAHGLSRGPLLGPLTPPQRPRQFLAQLADRQPHFRQQMPTLPIDGPDRLLLWAKQAEERDERIALQVRHQQIKDCSPAKAGVQGDVKPTSRCNALDPGLHRGTAPDSWPMACPILPRCIILFRTKTQSHEEEGLGREALFRSTVRLVARS